MDVDGKDAAPPAQVTGCNLGRHDGPGLLGRIRDTPREVAPPMPSARLVDSVRPAQRAGSWAPLRGSPAPRDPPPERVPPLQDDTKTSKDYYFDSYSHFGIHEEMLKDAVRTQTYMRSIVNNGFLFKDKVVLDVGCGTGILSLFASKAGAKHVYGIECSGIAEQAMQIVKDNGFADKVTIIKGKVEEITLPVDKVTGEVPPCPSPERATTIVGALSMAFATRKCGNRDAARRLCSACWGEPPWLLPCARGRGPSPPSAAWHPSDTPSPPLPQVDIIISEWMGYFLFYESMLDTVIFARDKWLNPGGLIFPDKATISICGIEDAEYKQDKIEYWQDVYGFDFSCIGKLALLEPLVDCVQADQICTNDAQICAIDINSMKKEDAHFQSAFELTATRNDFIHALVGYFDCTFSACHKPLLLPTSPRHRQTHWKQTVFYLEDTIPICKGETLKGTLTCAPNAHNPRDLDIVLSYSCNGRRCQVTRVQDYKMR